MAALYSRPLNAEEKEKLIDFLEAYMKTLAVREEDERAKTAKRKAIECLETSIDILVFVTTTWTMLQAAPLIREAIDGRVTFRRTAEQIVALSETGRSLDRARRPGGKP